MRLRLRLRLRLQGFPLASLRAVGAAYVGGGAPYFSAARLSPQLLDPAAARRDLARLRRDRRDARPDHDAARVALLRDASLRPWSKGAHVDVGRIRLRYPSSRVDAVEMTTRRLDCLSVDLTASL